MVAKLKQIKQTPRRKMHEPMNKTGAWLRQEPYAYRDPCQSACRKYIEIRYKLLQRFYDLLYQCTQTGLPICRAGSSRSWNGRRTPICGTAGLWDCGNAARKARRLPGTRLPV